MQELEELQEKHSTRPDVFDDVEEEHAIDILTAEISQVYHTTLFIYLSLLYAFVCLSLSPDVQ